MRPELKGTQTEKNLISAFAGESQVTNKYTFYSEKAKRDGYNKISEIFKITADNERAHARVWFNIIEDNLAFTETNLQKAMNGEHGEWTVMYADYAKTAHEEGFPDIARKFEMIASIEKEHEARFAQYKQELTNKNYFIKDGIVYWQCRNCGYIHSSAEAPEQCPVCGYPRAYFQVK